jgi:hypothetical protein
MDPHAELLRRRRWLTIGRLTLGGFLLLVFLGWLGGNLELTLPGAVLAAFLFVIWSIVGADWVRRPNGRILVAAAVLPAIILWLALREIFSEPNDVAEAVFLPAIAVAFSVACWWVLSTAVAHVGRISRAAQKRPH